MRGVIQRLKRSEQPLDWLLAVWPLVVGKRLAEHTRPVGCTEGVLEIGVSGAVWREQLAEMTGSLRSEINRWWGGELVRRVKLTPEPIALPFCGQSPAGGASAGARAKPPLPAEPAEERLPFIRKGAQKRRRK